MLLEGELSFCKWTACHMTFHSHKETLIHVKTYHMKGKVLACFWGDCTFTASRKSNLATHLKTHIPVTLATCYYCFRNFKYNVDFKRHITKHSEGEKALNAAAEILFEEINA